MIVHPPVDVVTVGAGWSAGILAQQLTASGLSVVSLERGPERYAHPDYAHNHDSIRNTVRKKMMHNLARETWTWRPHESAPSLPMRLYGAFHPGAGTGGSGAHWSAMLWRFLPTDFRYRSHHVERYGEKRLPEGTRVRDWPLSYEELEPFYTRAEYDIGASGKAGNLRGKKIPGGNVFEGPRSREYPVPPLAVTKGSLRFARACEELGYHPFTQPSGILSQAYVDISGRERSACLYCGFCTRFGCEVDAKASAGVSHIPLALATGRYEIRYLTTATGIEPGPGGLARGIRYVDAEGREHLQPAEIVVLSAYALSNVRLLLLSRSEAHPRGVGNDRGQVGKNLTYQIWQTPSIGVFEGERFHAYMGNTSTIKVIYDWQADNFDHTELDFVGGASIFSALGEREPVTSVGALPIGKGRSFGRDWKEAMRREWDSFLPITIQGESLPYEDNFFDLDPVYTDVYGQPLLRLTFDWHENERRMYRFVADKVRGILTAMGPTRARHQPELQPFNIHEYQSTHITGGATMGESPEDSVTNRYGQVWDSPNVFVTGAALYPHNPGANPSGTVIALAYWTAEAVKQRYLKEPGRLLAG